MELTQLTAISPIDGRYRGKCEKLDAYFSEWALIRYRVRVEIEYFIALSEIPLPALSRITDADKQRMRDIYQNFSIADAREIKEIESVTNHDVKAVEYFIKRRFDELGLGKEKEYVHFGLTSQDITNTAIGMAVLLISCDVRPK